MSRAYVLMTALPPTKGHLDLIKFAAKVGDSVEVVVCTQPDEPFVWERIQALRDATREMKQVNFHHIHRELPQEPEDGAGFWDMWAEFLEMFGLDKFRDYIVGSERYGIQLAEITGAKFIPYDLDRTINRSKATLVREHPMGRFSSILPQFQSNLRMTVTIFGAESTGKTTLANELARRNPWIMLPEWARPYLEAVGPEITPEKMEAIHIGQRALQDAGKEMVDSPVIVQDTDLFSTYGYWRYFDPKRKLHDLIADAFERESDLYIITPSNIPFVADPLRYGGHEREMETPHWVALAAEHALDHVVLEASAHIPRAVEATKLIVDHYTRNIVPLLDYQRRGAEYEKAGV